MYFYWIKCLGYQELGLFGTSSSLLVGSSVNLFITFVSFYLFVFCIFVGKSALGWAYDGDKKIFILLRLSQYCNHESSRDLFSGMLFAANLMQDEL